MNLIATCPHGFISIYALCEKNHSFLTVRYIGRTRTPRSRREAHMKESACPGRCKRLLWIRELRSKNKTPLMVLLDMVPKEEAAEAERDWINHFRAIGNDLVNSI